MSTETQRRGVAAVTGGGTGIGLATARALAEAGFDIAICGRRADVLDRAVTEIPRQAPGRVVVSMRADLGVPEDAERFVAFAIEQLGDLDVLVNNACTFFVTDFLALDASTWDAIADPGLRGVALCSAAAARYMRGKQVGRIVNVASMDALISEPNVAHYNAVKAGVSSLARSMAYDLSRYGITVNAVAPGWIKTPSADWALSDPSAMKRVNPVGRWGEPDEVANLICYLSTSAPTFLTGATIVIDGGQTAVAAMP